MGARRRPKRLPIPWKELFALARAMRLHAYAPYSKFRVGAAVLTADGSLFGGCNVENSSYGVSSCAERNALCTAVSVLGALRIAALAIVTQSDRPCPPCGMCRQMFAEFASAGLPVRSRTLKGRQASYRLEKLLPSAFSAQFL